MATGCGDVLSITDLQTAKKHQLFEAEVITGRQGGVATGSEIDYATNQVTGQVQKTLPAVLRDAGFSPAAFDFSTGGVLNANDRDKAVYDPVSKTWYVWQGALPHAIAANTNPVGDTNWKPWTDPTLRDDLASNADGKGDSLIAVKQPFNGSVGTTQHEVNKRIVNILDFGGNGDGVFDNATALQNAAAAVGAGGVIYFPALGGVNYKLGSGTIPSWTANRTIKTDATVRLTLPDAGYIDSTATFSNAVDLVYTSIQSHKIFPASLFKKDADRPVWASQKDADLSVLQRILPNTGDLYLGMYYRQYNQTTDTYVSATPTASSDSGYIIANSDANTQTIGFANLSNGDEMSGYFDSPSSSTTVNAVVMVNCTAGRVWYTCAANNTSNPTRFIRTGGAVISGPVAYEGMNTTPAYKFFASDITVRRNSSTSFSLLLNGFIINTVDVSSLGEISDIGLGCGGAGSITVSGITRRINATLSTSRYTQVCCFGDSISADSLGASWPNILRDSFDAMNGVRFSKVDNYAHAGDDSAAQRTVMDSVNLGNYNFCLMMLGVNDIQGGVTANTYLANMRYMINSAINNGNQVIVASPTIYYGQAQVGGRGQPTTNSDGGKYHRAGLRNLCAELNVKFVEMNQVIGPVLPSYITDPALAGKDSTLNDSIHPTSNTSYLFARAFYNALQGLMAPKANLDTPFREIGGTPGSGWSVPAGAEVPKWSRDSSGTITLDGLVNWGSGTAPANGSVVYTLPANIRPRFTTRQVVWADAVNARLLIDPNGSVQIYGMTSGSWVSLSGVSFKAVV